MFLYLSNFIKLCTFLAFQTQTCDNKPIHIEPIMDKSHIDHGVQLLGVIFSLSKNWHDKHLQLKFRVNNFLSMHSPCETTNVCFTIHSQSTLHNFQFLTFGTDMVLHVIFMQTQHPPEATFT